MLDVSSPMNHSFTIKSAHDGTTLELFERSGDYFLAQLTGPNFKGLAKVYEYEAFRLKAFFDGLAADWKGWPGTREWRSVEGELLLAAKCDSTGHISLSVHLQPGRHPFGWKLCAMLLVEAGQLDGIAASVGEFLDPPSASR